MFCHCKLMLKVSCTGTAKYREFRRVQSVQDVAPDIFRQKSEKIMVALLHLRAAGVHSQSLSCSKCPARYDESRTYNQPPDQRPTPPLHVLAQASATMLKASRTAFSWLKPRYTRTAARQNGCQLRAAPHLRRRAMASLAVQSIDCGSRSCSHSASL